jgi:hypothetical protein
LVMAKLDKQAHVEHGPAHKPTSRTLQPQHFTPQNGPYFRTHRGLRQGDPLSPLLFNLAADALSFIMNKAKEKGFIGGVVPHLVAGGTTHLQYSDDTILMWGGGRLET